MIARRFLVFTTILAAALAAGIVYQLGWHHVAADHAAAWWPDDPSAAARRLRGETLHPRELWRDFKHGATRPATPTMLHILNRLLNWIVPPLIVLHFALAWVNSRQDSSNPVRGAMTRFLLAKGIFWIAVELSLHLRLTVLWFVVYVLAVVLVVATVAELAIRLTRRYIFGIGLHGADSAAF